MAKLQWDIFCKVIDNFGDIGVSWRLAVDLAARGQLVRLWVDDQRALAWMAPGGCAGVQVMQWTETMDVSCLQTTPCDILIEAFGCDSAPEFIAACAGNHCAIGQNNAPNMLWINLEYLSAEPFAARCHGLTSLVSSGPAAGWRKVFYYPGFTPDTGGLLREPDLLRRQAAFDRSAWLNQHGINGQGQTMVSLFCYEPVALAQLLDDLEQHGINGQPVHLLVAAGRATEAVKAVEAAKSHVASKTAQNTARISLKPNDYERKQLSISYLPLLSQTDFDHLLWACDLNFVRGEDSLVRAIWAGKPFIWQIYPQDDDAHVAKLEAFFQTLAFPSSLRAFHTAWNGLPGQTLPRLHDLMDWQQTAATNQAKLTAQRDLSSGLIKYAMENR